MAGQAMAFVAGGKVSDAPHKTSRGNRPLRLITLDALTPFHLGLLVSFYEHIEALIRRMEKILPL